MILSLDISLRCTGYCVFDDLGTLIAFGTIKTDNKSSTYKRVSVIVTKVTSLVHKYLITRCIIEAPAFGARGSMSYYIFGLHFYLAIVLESLQLKPTQIAPTSLKKYATGNGKAKKPEMVDSLPENVRKLFVNSNLKKTTGLYDVTDAYFLGKKLLDT